MPRPERSLACQSKTISLQGALAWGSIQPANCTCLKTGSPSETSECTKRPNICAQDAELEGSYALDEGAFEEDTALGGL